MPCKTITIQGQTNESQLAVTDVRLSSPDPGTAVAEFDATNQVVSGSGETIAGTVEIAVDGNRVATESVSATPGETKTRSVEITNLDPNATVEICADIEG